MYTTVVIYPCNPTRWPSRASTQYQGTPERFRKYGTRALHRCRQCGKKAWQRPWGFGKSCWFLAPWYTLPSNGCPLECLSRYPRLLQDLSHDTYLPKSLATTGMPCHPLSHSPPRDNPHLQARYTHNVLLLERWRGIECCPDVAALAVVRAFSFSFQRFNLRLGIRIPQCLWEFSGGKSEWGREKRKSHRWNLELFLASYHPCSLHRICAFFYILIVTYLKLGHLLLELDDFVVNDALRMLNLPDLNATATIVDQKVRDYKA